MKPVLDCIFSDVIDCISVVRRVNACVPIFVFSNDVDCGGESVDTSVVAKVVGKAFFSDDTDIEVMGDFNWGTELLASMMDPEVTEEMLFICEVWET